MQKFVIIPDADGRGVTLADAATGKSEHVKVAGIQAARHVDVRGYRPAASMLLTKLVG